MPCLCPPSRTRTPPATLLMSTSSELVLRFFATSYPCRLGLMGKLQHNFLHLQPSGLPHKPVASDAVQVLLQQLPLLCIAWNSRNHCLERHGSSLHHPCKSRSLRPLENLSALKSGSHSRSHNRSESSESRLLISPLFLSLSAKANARIMKAKKVSVGEKDLKGGLYLFPLCLFPERSHPYQSLRRSLSIPEKSFQILQTLNFGTVPLHPDFH